MSTPYLSIHIFTSHFSPIPTPCPQFPIISNTHLPLTQIGQICWTEIPALSIPRAQQFYGKVFGWEFTSFDMTACSTSELSSFSYTTLFFDVAFSDDKLEEDPPLVLFSK